MDKIKRIVLIIFLLAFIHPVFAQGDTNSSDHLTFKGVPIDGTLNEFVSKMKQKDLTLIGSEDGIAMLKGDFAAYKNCIIGVSTLKQKDLVSRITVIFPESDTWSSLSSNYFLLKELLTEKYGEPSAVIEKFNTTVEPKDDYSKMYEVLMNNCKYYTTYEMKNGSIQLSIENKGFLTSFVMLTYFDKINSEVIRQKAIDDL